MVQAVLNSLSEMELPAENIAAWLLGIANGRKQEEVDRIEKAAKFAIVAHTGQKRTSGEDYVNHTFAVAAIVHELGLDSDVVIAALLHDTVEDTPVTLEQIQTEFGDDVSRMVDGVTKMEAIQEFSEHETEHGEFSNSETSLDTKRHTQQLSLVASDNKGETNKQHDIKAESLRKMMLAMVDDVRVVLIKLSDRLHNMRTLHAVNPNKQKRVATETLEIFSPLANRLGVWQVKWELEYLAFR